MRGIQAPVPGTQVLRADIASPAVLKRLKQLEPDAFWVTAPCINFSPSGKGIEGEAASVLPSVARLAVNIRPKLVFHKKKKKKKKSRTGADTPVETTNSH
eukprot:TRINITY_DN993_c0_g1_i2.p2 TRINITY_DN993_c0_g1~~TRINITY_DN993_c0_g1_i2.p2  ORF type:complete len:100 (-),score=10.95 TRINITY_DN993_c0_g1_i2:65-364(-)